MKILAIETSCDETAIAVLEIKNKNFKILFNIISSQVKIHAKWGGVVPNLAKREHQRNLPIVLKKALKKAGFEISNFKFLISKQIPIPKNQIPSIDLIAVVNGPGLEPALWTGINFAENLAKEWKKPLIPINHLEGHLFSVFIKQKQFPISNFQFPIIALLVSGGHTQLILIKDWLKYQLLGETRDDAAGEAFDKVARMMKLGYPGGPAIAAVAAKFEARNPKGETNSKFSLPRPMIDSKNYDFSFSGLKTAVLYKTKELKKLTPKIKSEICAEFQQAVIDVLISKTIKATKEYKAKTIIMAGGVAANKELRKQFKKVANTGDSKYKLLLPEMKFTGDNAAMIALAAYFRWQKKRKPGSSRRAGLKAEGNLKLN